MVGEVKADLQEILTDTSGLKDEEIQRLELRNRILEKKISDLEKKMRIQSEINALQRSHEEQQRTLLEEQLRRQLQETQIDKADEKHYGKEEDIQACDRQDCRHPICDACNLHWKCESEMLEHRQVCGCHPQSQLFGMR